MINYNQISAPIEIFSLRFVIIYALSVALLIVSSKIQVPMIPVPITFQTAVILLIPALFGMKANLSVLSSWLFLGVLGAPVFASPVGIPGLAYFIGPTGGYFVGFVMAAVITAFVIHTLKLKSLMPLISLFLLMHALILFTGWVWLSYGIPQLGVEKAWLAGVFPFLTGSVLKSAFVLAIVYPAFREKTSAAH